MHEDLKPFEETLKLADAWPAEQPPPELAANTMARIRQAAEEQSAQVSLVDRWAGWVRSWFEGPSRRWAFAFATVLLVCVFAGRVISPNMQRYHAQGELAGCRANLEHLAQALEAFHRDRGNYPASLDELLDGYLKAVPDCPAAGTETYRAGYQLEGDGFVLACHGHHHGNSQLGPDYPQYSSKLGSSPE
ncbi:MAG: hypothetical protein KC910_10665 [Candidatus Eremiobacteraeota bacterium]|nr:hypothetical protein [Candidatus Eremiobacteraeota bacterium]